MPDTPDNRDFETARAALADPRTSAERLAEIAELHPSLHVAVERHPNVYPDLIEWISQYPPELRYPTHPADAAPTVVIGDAAPTMVYEDAGPTMVYQDAGPTMVYADAAPTSVQPTSPDHAAPATHSSAVGATSPVTPVRQPSAAATPNPMFTPAPPATPTGRAGWNPWAVMSPIVAVVIPAIGTIAGIVLGHLGLSQTKKTGERGRGFAVAGLVIGYGSIIAVAVWLVFSMLMPSTTQTSATGDKVQSSSSPSASSASPTESASATPSMDETQARAWLETESTSYPLNTDGHYLVALASKYAGVTDPRQTAANGTQTFMYVDIVAEYKGLQTRFGTDVHLVKSTSFGKQVTISGLPAGESLYVTIYDPGTFGSKESADQWCATQFPSLSGDDLKNVCFPRQASPPQ